MRFLHFLASGIPGIAIATLGNYVLVSIFHLPAMLVYGPVLLIQMLVNYTACRKFVFSAESHQYPFWLHFVRFVGGSAGFRIADWLIYILLLNLGVNFLLAQLLNVAVFSILRYRFTSWLFRKRPASHNIVQ